MSESVATDDEVLRRAGVVPDVGSRWEWEPLKPHARCTLEVVGVEWNGEDWWVEARITLGRSSTVPKFTVVDADGTYRNELSRWVEATVLLNPAE